MMELKKRERIVGLLEEELKYVIGLQHRLECCGEDTPGLDRNIAMLSGALALIQELTDENDRLHSIINSECERCACELLDQRDKMREEAERYKRYYFHHEYDKWEAEIKADTVRRMQERLNDTKFRMCGGGECYIYAENIDVIAKELLEENNV